MSMTAKSHIYVGIGGWTFEPWRGVFYPKGLPHSKELAYASERLTSIEVNGTFYRTQISGNLPEMGERGAGRLCVFHQGFALRHQPPRAERSRRIDRTISQFRRDRAWRQARSTALAIRPVQEIRRGRFWRLSRAAARDLQRPAAPPRRRGAARQFQDAGVRRAAAEIQHRRRVHRSRNVSEHRRYHRRLRLRAAAAGRGHDPHRLSAEGAWSLDQAAPHLGVGQGAGRPAARGSEAQAEGRAARRVCLCDPRGQGAGAGGGDGADRGR